ncbi:MAG: regulatory protein [Flavobacterium sp.]
MEKKFDFSKSLTNKEILKKMEHFCAYQERCHEEVNSKLYDFVLSEQEKNEIIYELIQNNYINEERFASLFTLSKFHQKKWGKIRITNELKFRKISAYLIKKSIVEIPEGEYYDTFETLSERIWNSITEKNRIKKRKKFCDNLLRKGWESDWVYKKAVELEK